VSERLAFLDEAGGRGWKVHPVAALFPMMSDAELDDLAADIKANGLQYPIMLDADAIMLVDGRNRMAACRRAGVKPQFEQLAYGADPVAHIWSANAKRRHMTKGQLAITAGRTRLLDSNNLTQDGAAKLAGLTRSHLAQAEIILQFAPELADNVLINAEPFDTAYKKATGRKQEASSEAAKMVRLQEMAPDLADLVTEERMSLAEAMAGANQRVEERRQAIDAGRRAAERLTDFCTEAVTIAAAAELGERDLVTEDQLARLDDAMILLRRIQRQGEPP